MLVRESIGFKRGKDPYNVLNIGEEQLLDEAQEIILDMSDSYNSSFLRGIENSETFDDFFQIIKEWNFNPKNFKENIVNYASPGLKIILMNKYNKLYANGYKKTEI